MIVKPAVASAFAVQKKSAWIELASGTAVQLERWLGEAEIGDHLPGLGEISGWGLIDIQGDVTGAIYTGFDPNPSSVSIMLSAICVGNKLSLGSLMTMLRLPKGCLRSLRIRSLVSQGNGVTRVLDRGQTVLDTRSPNAISLAKQLTAHLVSDAFVSTTMTVDHEANFLTVFKNTQNFVERYSIDRETHEAGSVHILDWEG